MRRGVDNDDELAADTRRIDFAKFPPEIVALRDNLKQKEEAGDKSQSIIMSSEGRHPAADVSQRRGMFWLTPHVSADFEVAYRMMCCRYIESCVIEGVVTESLDIDEAISELMPSTVDFNLEITLLNDLWIYFRPHGMLLSAEAQLEVVAERERARKMEYLYQIELATGNVAGKDATATEQHLRVPVALVDFKTWMNQNAVFIRHCSRNQREVEEQKNE